MPSLISGRLDAKDVSSSSRFESIVIVIFLLIFLWSETGGVTVVESSSGRGRDWLLSFVVGRAVPGNKG